MTFIDEDHAQAVKRAKEIMEARPLFVDTETTGLGIEAEVCDLAVVDYDGSVIFSSLLKPTCPIPPEATAIHGITNEMVENAPPFRAAWPFINALFFGRKIVTYNAAYDSRLITQSVYAGDLIIKDVSRVNHGFDYICAMLLFARFHGEYDPVRRSYRWQSLGKAAQACGYPAYTAHRALGDALAARAVVAYMAEEK